MKILLVILHADSTRGGAELYTVRLFHKLLEAGNEVFPGRPKAGISGAPVKWAGLEMTRLLKQYRDEFGYSYKVVGIGGVLNAQDFQEYRDAGADIVMSVTGAMWDPQLAAEIKANLK